MIDAATTPPRTEGPVAKAIEHQTSRMPSDIFLWTALGVLGVSAFRNATHRGGGQFMAQLVPTLLLLGVYNKLVKVAGSDRFEQSQFARQGDVR